MTPPVPSPRPRRFRGRLAAAALFVATLPALPTAPGPAFAAVQQSPGVESTTITVLPDAATLETNFTDGTRFRISLAEGQVLVDGERQATYREGGALEGAWREFLRTGGVEADPASLALALSSWRTPEEAAGSEAASALQSAVDSLASRVASAPAPSGERRSPAGEEAAPPAPLTEEFWDEFGERWEERWEEEWRERSRDLRERSHRWGPSRGVLGDVWDNVTDGLGTFFTALSFFIVLAILGAIPLYFARPQFRAVAGTVKRDFGRSFLAGLAGQFLFLPALVVLCIGILTIPLIPVFVLAVGLALLGGYVAAAYAVGEAVSQSDLPRLSRLRSKIRGQSPYWQLLLGLVLLQALYVVIAFLQLFGHVTGLLEGLTWAAATLVTWLAFTAGFGAVLLSRAGTRSGPGTPGPGSGPAGDRPAGGGTDVPPPAPGGEGAGSRAGDEGPAGREPGGGPAAGGTAAGPGAGRGG